MRRIPIEERNQIVGMLQAGLTISRRFGARRQTIRKIYEKFCTRGSVKDLPRSGRPPIFTPRQERIVKREFERDPFVAASEVAQNWGVSGHTVRRILRRYGIRSRRPYWGAILSSRHRRLRKIFADKTRTWRQEWTQVLFSDESRFSLHSSDRRIPVYRKKNERYMASNVRQYNRFQGKSLMVWGGISKNWRTPLVFLTGNVTSESYVGQILEPEVIPFMNAYPEVWIFQQDNAPAHSSVRTTRFLEENRVKTLPWPSMSPDLNPIEHLWDHLKRQLRKMRPEPKNLDKLRQTLQYLWTIYLQTKIARLIDSMPRRIEACRAKFGGHTHY